MAPSHRRPDSAALRRCTRPRRAASPALQPALAPRTAALPAELCNELLEPEPESPKTKGGKRGEEREGKDAKRAVTHRGRGRLCTLHQPAFDTVGDGPSDLDACTLLGPIALEAGVRLSAHGAHW